MRKLFSRSLRDVLVGAVLLVMGVMVMVLVVVVLVVVRGLWQRMRVMVMGCGRE